MCKNIEISIYIFFEYLLINRIKHIYQLNSKSSEILRGKINFDYGLDSELRLVKI